MENVQNLLMIIIMNTNIIIIASQKYIICFLNHLLDQIICLVSEDFIGINKNTMEYGINNYSYNMKCRCYDFIIDFLNFNFLYI